MSKMSKAELIAAVSQESEYTEEVVRTVLDSTYVVMRNALVCKIQPYMLGLGNLYTIKRAAGKRARDIRRGIEVVVPARTVVLFKPSKPLREAVNPPKRVRKTAAKE